MQLAVFAKWLASFSALQRAEIAETNGNELTRARLPQVSVLFNEPKLLKSTATPRATRCFRLGFSALQRAEIAEIQPPLPSPPVFQTPTPARRRS